MCNAFKHPSGCTCGFGGDGHLGRSQGAAGRSSGTSGSGTGFGTSSMSAFAESLGHSVVFPVDCKHCGGPIWLYANPNGGFAIFNQLGKPWPKHECRGVVRNSKDCLFRQSPSPDYEFPVPSSAVLALARPGSGMKGVVVEIKDTALPTGQWQGNLLVYSAEENRLYRVTVGESVQHGALLTGYVDARSDGSSFLNIVQQQLPPPSKPAPPPGTVVKIRLGTKRTKTGRESVIYASFRIREVVHTVAEVVALLRKTPASEAIRVFSPQKDTNQTLVVNHGTILKPVWSTRELADFLERLNAEFPSNITIGRTGTAE